MHARCLAITALLFAVGCHPPPPELVEAKRVVVIVGPPERASIGPYYQETPFETLELSACAAACPGVARAGERLTACYVLAPHALGVAPGPSSQPVERRGDQDVAVSPSLLHVCTLQPVGADE